MPKMDTIIEMIKLGSVGIVAGLFSAYISNRSHRDKKWWELRVSSYQVLIESLSDLIYYIDAKWTAETMHRDINDAYEAELKNIWNDSFHKVRKSADAGIFLFSEEVNKALNDLIKYIDSPLDTYFETVERDLHAAKKCLKTVVTSANKDLRLTKSFF